MSEQKFELIAGTDTLPPQVRNEHLAPDADENGESPSAKAAVDAWYAEHEQKLEAAKVAQAERTVKK
jgi:hypothetical protein